MKLWALVIASLAVGACATTPAPPSQPAAGTQSAAAAAKPPAVAAPLVPDTELTRWAKAQGYRPMLFHQDLIWCKKDTTTGSRIAQQACVSDAKLASMRESDEAAKQFLLRQTVACPASSCGQSMPR